MSERLNSTDSGLEFLSAMAAENADFIANVLATINKAVAVVQVTAQVAQATTALAGGSPSAGPTSFGSAGSGSSLSELLRTRAG